MSWTHGVPKPRLHNYGKLHIHGCIFYNRSAVLSVMFALEVIAEICWFQFRSHVIVMPRYLADSTVNLVVPKNPNGKAMSGY